MLARQMEIEHAQRKLKAPCPFCGQHSVELWFDPEAHKSCRGFQVRCRACGARGPQCDCGDESALPMWIDVARRPEIEAKQALYLEWGESPEIDSR